MRSRLGALQRRSTLAHAFYVHAGSTPFNERHASRRVATRLITKQGLLDACGVAETPQGMAHVLGVLPRDVRVYISTLTPAEIDRISDIITTQENHEYPETKYGSTR